MKIENIDRVRELAERLERLQDALAYCGQGDEYMYFITGTKMNALFADIKGKESQIEILRRISEMILEEEIANIEHELSSL